MSIFYEMESPIGAMQTIHHQLARAMVTTIGWKMVCNGCEAYSKDGLWVVYKAGYLYRRRKVAMKQARENRPQ